MQKTTFFAKLRVPQDDTIFLFRGQAIMQKTKINLKKELSKGVGLFVLLLCLRFAGENEFAFVLCFGLFVSSMFCGMGVATCSAAYFASSLFFGMTVFLWCATSLVSTFAIFLIYKILKKSSRAFCCSFFVNKL